MSKTHSYLAAALAASLLLSACGAAAPTAAPAAATAKPAEASGPKKGGKVTMGVWQSPATLNGLLGTQTVMNDVLAFVTEGLTNVQGDGSRIPALAKEVPTVQNGGVSADGKTITYKLVEGVKFHDGTPFGCEDLQATLKAIMTPGVGIVSTTGYSDIDTIDCGTPNTAIVKYKNFFAPYLTLFGGLELIPRSAGDPAKMKDWSFNTKPIGTGPFKVVEFKADEFVRLARNTDYRVKDQPYLDEVIIRIVPSSEVARQLLASGEIDVMWNNTEADLPEIEKLAGVKVSKPLQIGGERMFLNLAENKDPSDPKKPHPILSDLKVRQAIAYGINKQRIIDKLLNGQAKPGTSELNTGYFECKDIQPFPYDAAKAKALLDEAGWKAGADGIREKGGVKLRLKYSTTSGNKLREDSQVLVVEDMKAIGVDMFIENAPSSVVIGAWDGASPRRHGNFDIIMYTTNAGIDPHSQMVNLWASARIPSEANKGGTNYTRFSDPKADELLANAGKEPDAAKRKGMYCELAKMTYDQVNMIYLYQRLKIDSYRDRLQNFKENAWNSIGWNAAEWWVK
ncbi:MAG: peptide ABC transporter substrate-binding protein [Thermoflexales bacterium]|nr:peptide ABC transporter substrate-binding protein [Thermoflexales bacterium]MBP8241704.1 peptide ABC transporter substrate-binding protein [Thermoflexales bacterium]